MPAFHRRAALLALLALLGVCMGGITPLVNYQLSRGSTVYQRVGMYAKPESPFGVEFINQFLSQLPYMTYSGLTYRTTNTPANTSFAGKLELVFMHHSYRAGFGIGGSLLEDKTYCCTDKLANEGKCATPRSVILNNVTLYNHADYPGIKSSADGLLVYDSTISLANVGNFLYNVNKSGVYYLFLSNCQDESDLLLDGKLLWLNPYGYLPGQILGYLPSYWILFILYSLVTIWFTLITIRYRKDLLGLQILVLVFLLCAWLENLTWGCDYVVYNKNGMINDTVNVFGALFTSTKSTLIRTVLLLTSVGYSITRPVLPKRITVGVIILTLVYFVLMAITQYLDVATTAGAYVAEWVKVFFEVILILANIAFGIWIVLALMAQMRYLKLNQQTEKYSLYMRLATLLIVVAILAIIFYIAQVSVTFADFEDESFRVWWIWEILWEFFYFAVATTIAIIWRPSEQNLQYAFSEQIPSYDAENENADKNEIALEEQSEKPKADSKGDDESSSFSSKHSQ